MLVFEKGDGASWEGYHELVVFLVVEDFGAECFHGLVGSRRFTSKP